MNLLERFSRDADGRRRFALTVLTLAVFCFFALTLCGGAWAQDDDDDSEAPAGEAAASAPGETEGPMYVGSYALVILCVGLGVMLVCRSANRHSLTKKWKATGLLESVEGGEEGGEEEGPGLRTKRLCKDAQAGLSFSIAGLIPVAGIFLGAFGLWKSIHAKKMIAQNKLLSGDGMALAGIIIGPIAIVISLGVTVVLLVKMFG